MLLKSYTNKLIEAGCDEAGRGCLAGPVVAAAVILPLSFEHELLNDSKQLSEDERNELRMIIENEADAYSVAFVDNNEIDKVNILNASFEAMHRAIDLLPKPPEMLLIDGNRFKPYKELPFECVIKGDGKYMSIAAASVLAKTYRDEYMRKLSDEYPDYGWCTNVGYPTIAHREAIRAMGLSPFHRRSFRQLPNQLSLFEDI